VQKSVEELDLSEASFGSPQRQFPLNAATLGLAYDLFHIAHLTVAGGAQATISRPPQALRELYGKAPLAGEVYLHIYPGRM